ncbi:MAG: protein phosphatase 2C domain-containing protein [Kiritimatiellae bacterium]|nr:protein phosphatase 2C domain-containing protein [Kiritimatiellia bacterium]
MDNPFTYLNCAELTNVGKKRKNNEDSMVSLLERGLFCVADGMGGVQGGAVASQAVADALREAFTDSPDAPFAVTAKASARMVARALNSASQWIKERADERGLAGSGSTAVVLAFDCVTPSRALILHAGDSRAYRLRSDKLTQLSADHSVAAAAGLTNERDLPAMFRGVITRAVGLDPTVELEETEADVATGDLFLLCSDGLTKMVPDKLIHKILRKHASASLDEQAQLLIDAALDAGGEDNVTVVLVRVDSDLPQAPTMEIPPETLILEALPVAPPPAARLPANPMADTDERGFDAPTAETGQTPPTPCSESGHTPMPITVTAKTGFPQPHPANSTRNIVVMLALVVMLFAAAVAGLRVIYRRAQGQHLPLRPDTAESSAPSATEESRAPQPDH